MRNKVYHKKRLIISFSGGRTSGFMLWWLWFHWPDRENWDIIVVFANTGKEVEGTLFFVDECAQEWNIPIVWVEGYPSDKGKGWAVNHKIVSYETASRNGEPFEALIKRLGIPCSEAPFCSDQMKRKAIESYAKSIGWESGTYSVAIGIREDEPKRYLTKAGKRKVKKNRLLPLVDLFPVAKAWVITWWNNNTFNLDIHVDDGNCDNCWKKSFKVLARNQIRKPKSFDWWDEMIIVYAPRERVNFYRGNTSVSEIEAKAVLLRQKNMTDCGESCEAF